MDGLVRQWLSVGTTLGEVRTFTAKMPSPARLPVVMILHSAVGLDGFIQTMAEQFAKEGYWAVAPDLYSNDDVYRELDLENIEIAAHMSRDPVQVERELAPYEGKRRAGILKACEWIARRPNDTYVEMVQAVFRAVQSYPEAGSIGAIGFCMGGRLVGELAETTPALAAGVMHYGRPPKIESAPIIPCPLEGHYGSRDPNITEKVPPFAAAMAKAGKKFDYYIYEADHGFSLAPHLQSYEPKAARLSMERSRQFLRRHLMPELDLAERQARQ